MKRFFSTVIGSCALILGFVFVTASNANAQQVIGKITPDSVWIPCGATQTVNLMFSSTNGVSVSNFSIWPSTTFIAVSISGGVENNVL